ncbi:hypothetical protein [Lactococcus garvieae]|uniref:Lipoprotein n=1 Tax=Lactococcus garvieae DCC43 TaxID=1231377 RepID=K2NS46_9LACT|nr:hypothetical protein [Lactococcus garvieae]EKF50408.1 hypothetical protein C426_2248 [Lactococcus garvieae DCC43]
MNKKMMLTIALVGAISIGLSANLLLQNKNNNVKATPQTKQEVKPVTQQSSQKPQDKPENLAIKTALNDFASLDEFNAQFSPVEDNMTASFTPDEQWMIPDLSDVGSNDGGKTHGWTGARTKEEAQDTDVTDMNTGKVVYTFKVSDGASAGEIRKALAERDKTK